MKIGIVCFAWGPDHRGGLETHVAGLAKIFSKNNHQVYIHCVNRKDSGDQFSTRGWQEGELHIQEARYDHKDIRSLLDFQCVPQAEIILKDWITRNKLDIVHFHHNLCFGMRAIQKASELVPTVVSLHDYFCLDPHCSLFGADYKIIEPEDFESWEINAANCWPNVTSNSTEAMKYYVPDKVNKLKYLPKINLKYIWIRYSSQMLQYASVVVAPSKEAATIHHSHGIKKDIKVVENGLNISFSRGELAKEKNHDSIDKNNHIKIRIGILGTVAPHKGQLKFCQAILKDELQEYFTIKVFGPIPNGYQGNYSCQTKIFEIAEQYPDFLELRGAYDKEDLPSIFSELDIAAMPSLWQEIYGFVAREALGYGLPIITTDAGGLASLRGHEGVFVLPMADPDNWNIYLKKGLQQEPFYRWTYQRRKGIPMSSEFIPNDMECVEKLEAIYQSLIANRLTI